MTTPTPGLEAQPEAIAAAQLWRVNMLAPEDLRKLLTWTMRAMVVLMSHWSSTEAPKLLSGTSSPTQPRLWCAVRLAAAIGLSAHECAELCEAAISAVGWPSEADLVESVEPIEREPHPTMLAAQRKRDRKNAERQRRRSRS